MKKLISSLCAVVGIMLLGTTYSADLSMCNGGVFPGGEVRFGMQYPISDTFHTANAAIMGAGAGTKIIAQNANVGALNFTNGGNRGGPVPFVTPGSTRIADSTVMINQQSKDIVIEWHIANCAYNGNGGCVAGTTNVHVECMTLTATRCGDGQVNGGEQCDGGAGCNEQCQRVETPVCEPNENTRCEGTTLVTRKTLGNQPYCNEQVVNRQENHPSCQAPKQCPELNLDKGNSCNDNNPNTQNDLVGDDCICRGTPITTTYQCPDISKNKGDQCDDGKSDTINDKINDACQCQGTPRTTPNICPTVGQACNRNQCGGGGTHVQGTNGCECSESAPTIPGNFDQSCTSQPNNCGDRNTGKIGCGGVCVVSKPADRQCDQDKTCDPRQSQQCEGTTLVTKEYKGTHPNCNQETIRRQENHPSCITTYQCPEINKNKGQSCDDGNPNTQNDRVGDDCVCRGNPVYSCPSLGKNKGDSCNDNNNDTKNDVVTGECVCQGQPKNKCGDGIVQKPNDYGQNEQCDGTAGVGAHQVCSQTCDLINLYALGDYVWLDGNGNGIQDTNEVPVPNIKVELYKGCGVSNGVFKTTSTNAAGKYLFPDLFTGNYTVKFVVDPKLYEFTDPNRGSNRALDSNPGPTGVTSCINLTADDLTIDAGLILQQPVSCESLTINRSSAGVNSQITYDCKHQGATSAEVTIIQSGTTNVVARQQGFQGTITVPGAAGEYIVKCTLDGTIDYKIFPYQANGTQKVIYREHKSQGSTTRCAIPTTLDPQKRIPLPLDSVLTRTKPIPICTFQLTDPNYIDVQASNESLLIKDETSCKVPLRVVQGAQLGDRLWQDTNRNGIQDNGEPGIGGSSVQLVACASDNVLANTTTAANGLYLFDNLQAGSYRVKFTLPSGYEAFTVKGAGANPTIDSNANADGRTDCVTLAANESNLTIDAGVYARDAGCTSNCGGGGYKFCGDGKINTSYEQCDDGNVINGDGCSSSCQYDTNQCVGDDCGTPTTANIIGFVCESIDPPSVNLGEYLPFWWTMEKNDKVKFVTNCSQSQDGVTNILRASTEDDPICHFALINGKGEEARFSRYCFDKLDLTQYPLFDSFFSKSSIHLSDYKRAINPNLARSFGGGASFVGPNNRKQWTNGVATTFSALGEYRLALTSTTFKTCNRVSTAVNNRSNATTWVKSNARYQSKNQYGFGRECSYNLTVTKPYFVQEGKSLAIRTVDIDTIKSFYGFQQTQPIFEAIKQFKNYETSQNFNYLITQFITKYQGLATEQTTIPLVSKVPNQEIYVYRGNEPITLGNGTSIKGTLISTQANVLIKGNLEGIGMILAPNNTIDFQATQELYDETQVIQGIYIASTIRSSKKVFNDELGHNTWATKGNIRLKGIMISKGVGADIDTVVANRRSYLDQWFNTDTQDFGQTNKQKAILKGAALVIETDPAFWLELPPGANELMKALEMYK